MQSFVGFVSSVSVCAERTLVWFFKTFILRSLKIAVQLSELPEVSSCITVMDCHFIVAVGEQGQGWGGSPGGRVAPAELTASPQLGPSPQGGEHLLLFCPLHIWLQLS